VVPQRKDHSVTQKWTQQSCSVSWYRACLLSMELLAGVHDVSVKNAHFFLILSQTSLQQSPWPLWATDNCSVQKCSFCFFKKIGLL